MTTIKFRVPENKKHTVAASGLREIESYEYLPKRFPNKRIATVYINMLLKQQFLSSINRREARKMVVIQ